MLFPRYRKIPGHTLNAADIGRNLNLRSEQDSSTYQARQQSAAAGISVGLNGQVGGNISGGKSNTNSNYQSVIEQTAINAGSGGFDIHVNDNTDLKGAVINSTATADNNRLVTGTLTTGDIQNHGHYQADSMNLGVNVGGNLSTGTGKPAGSSKGGPVMDAGIGGLPVSTSGEASGTTKAAIAQADITITDEAGQKAKTGKDAATTVATLNHDTQHANGSIQNPFNQQKVQEQLEFLQVAGEEIVKPVGAKLANWIGDTFKPDPEHPDRIDSAKVAAHAALGAAMSTLLGTGWQSGALGGAMGDVLPNVLAKAFETDPATGKPKNEEAFKAATAIIAAALASATGSDLAQTISAGMTAKNAVENNWLKHQEKIDLAQFKQACGPSNPDACKNATKLEILDKLRDQKLLNACVNLSPEACATELNLDPAAKAFFVENFNTIAFGRIVAQFGTNAAKAAPPPQLLDITLDLTPIVGDVKGFAEAQSPFDYTIAVIGALGPAGDAAKALVKEAKVLMEAGDTVKAAEKLDAAQIVVANAARGKVFETALLDTLKLDKNTTRIPVTLTGGKQVTVIPDALGKTIIEAKDVKYLSNSDQFRGYAATKKPIELYVSPDTKISAPLIKLINDSQGSIKVFDPTTKTFSTWTPK